MERFVAIGLAECMPLITERLSSGQSVEFMAHGTSMKPMLHDSYVTLSPAPKRLVRGDLPLCPYFLRGNSGRYGVQFTDTGNPAMAGYPGPENKNSLGRTKCRC